MKNLILFILPLVFIATADFASSQNRNDSVDTSMVADISDIESDKSFYIGILFEMKPGWHIYWKNPGDSGMPTRVDFILPENFTQSDLFWPVPRSFTRSGNIRDFGYKDKVLLWKKITVPSGHNPEAEIPVKANISWVSCREVCVAGNKQIKSVIRPGKSPGIYNKELFERWEQKLPVKKGQEYSYYTENIPAEDKMSKFRINLDFKNITAKNIEWFPDSGETLKIERIEYDLGNPGDKGAITFFASLYPGKMLSSPNIPTVLVVTGPDGKRTGYKMPVKVIEVLKKRKPPENTE